MLSRKESRKANDFDLSDWIVTHNSRRIESGVPRTLLHTHTGYKQKLNALIQKRMSSLCSPATPNRKKSGSKAKDLKEKVKNFFNGTLKP